MHADEIRFLFAYDRWATKKSAGCPRRPGPSGMESDARRRRAWLGRHPRPPPGRLATLARRVRDTGGDGEGPEPEREPLPTIEVLRERWEAEWAAVDAWLPTVTDDFVGHVHDGVAVWQMLVHVVNHGTQHRSEAAALLTADGRSPGSWT